MKHYLVLVLILQYILTTLMINPSKRKSNGNGEEMNSLRRSPLNKDYNDKQKSQGIWQLWVKLINKAETQGWGRSSTRAREWKTRRELPIVTLWGGKEPCSIYAIRLRRLLCRRGWVLAENKKRRWNSILRKLALSNVNLAHFIKDLSLRVSLVLSYMRPMWSTYTYHIL